MKSIINKLLLEEGIDPFDWDIEELYLSGRKNLFDNIESYSDKNYPCSSVITSLFKEGVFQHIKRKGKSKTQILIEQETHDLITQKQKIEEKNKEITESIQYAKNLQSSILPSNDKINKHLQNHNIIYLPKDIIGGDFYWFESTQEFIYFAVADCTGHGVPGGMVSLICVNALNKSFKEERLIETSDILNRSRQLIIETFNNNGQNVYDGMDIIICRWSKSTNQLSFSGANRPLWILRGQTGLIDEFKTDRFPVGKFFDEKPFSDFSTHLDKNDLLFMFSDGIVDQFGKEGKFKTSRLKNLILKNRDYHLSYQSQFIKDAFLEWKDSEEQTDDVCMWIINL